MANSTRKTQKDFYNELLALAINDEQRDFINGRIAQLDKKANSKSGGKTATQKENETLKDKMLEEMDNDRAYTVTMLNKEIECLKDYSNQKISALCKQLVEENKVVRTEDKKKAYFTKA